VKCAIYLYGIEQRTVIAKAAPALKLNRKSILTAGHNNPARTNPENPAAFADHQLLQVLNSHL
jgi:hypothetical protein